MCESAKTVESNCTASVLFVNFNYCLNEYEPYKHETMEILKTSKNIENGNKKKENWKKQQRHLKLNFFPLFVVPKGLKITELHRTCILKTLPRSDNRKKNKECRRRNIQQDIKINK